MPLADGKLLATGKVGEAVTAEEAVTLARACALNALAAAAAAAGGLSAITRIIKVTGFVASAPGFTGQPQVVNGASDLLTEVFGDAGKHARSAVGVAVLPLDAPVEVELIAEVGGTGTGGGHGLSRLRVPGKVAARARNRTILEAAVGRARRGRGRRATLLPPTAITLRELAAEPDVAALLAARRRIVPRRPVVTFTDGQAWLTIPEEPGSARSDD